MADLDITNSVFNFGNGFRPGPAVSPQETGRAVVAEIRREFDRRLSTAGQDLVLDGDWTLEGEHFVQGERRVPVPHGRRVDIRGALTIPRDPGGQLDA